MSASKYSPLGRLAALTIALLFSYNGVHAATQPVDLDALPANASESMCSTDVLSISPVRIQNKVTNRTNGDAFTFSWPSAGPGGFTSSVTAGNTGTGVGAVWVWTTDQSVVGFTGTTCATDVCFAQTSGPDAASGFCSDACLADGTTVTLRKGAAGAVDLSWTGGSTTFTVYRGATKIGVVAPTNSVGTTNNFTFTDTPPANANAFYVVRGTDCSSRKACTTNADCSGPSEGTCLSRGPFGVPGRTLVAGDVTVSAASLTSSLITFFSPPTTVFTITETTNAGGVTQLRENTSPFPQTSTTAAFPPGCCPADPDHPHQLRCGDECVDYLSDPDNCGACGNSCGEEGCCSNGTCLERCGEGQTFCGGECVYLNSDDDNCGECGHKCGDGGCCSGGSCHSLCDEGQLFCGESCIDPGFDDQNCGSCFNECGAGTCCTAGDCLSLCEPDWTYCGETGCADLRNDNENCGACGNKCMPGSCCNNSVCESLCEAGKTWCFDLCVDLNHDSENCGGCDLKCGEGDCCDGGECSHFECPAEVPHTYPSACPNNYPTEPVPGVCPADNWVSAPPPPAAPAYCPDAFGDPPASSCPESPYPAPDVEEAPVCTTPEITTIIAPGETQTICTPGGPLFREVASSIAVCGDGLPGVDGTCGGSAPRQSTGTFSRLIPDPRPVGNAFVTPYAIHAVTDSSNDGLLQPGESAGLRIDLVNAGPMPITNARATLSIPAADLTSDGINNPVGIDVGCGSVWYGTILETPPATDCVAPPPRPASNSSVIPISVPSCFPGDVSVPIFVTVTGTVNGAPYTMNVPMSLGISDNCNYSAHTRDFDGLVGLKSPMAKLVPAEDTVRFPSHAFEAGQKRLLRLRQKCGSRNLNDLDSDAPQIVALSEADRGPIDVATLWEERTDTRTTFFHFDHDFAFDPDDDKGEDDADDTDGDVDEGGHHDNSYWVYKLRTSNLGCGTFKMTIRIAGQKDYVTGFVLH